MTISPQGGRVLGCLVEKQLTTPQQYPLTLNALASACSQSTNREPVMTLDEAEVQGALDEIKALRLVRFVLPSHGKSVTRFRHALDEVYGLDTSRLAVLAVLLLRGPQTVGELRARTARMVEFDSIVSLQDDLTVLADQAEPLVRLISRRPGQKEDRWQQLLAAESEDASTAGQSAVSAAGEMAAEIRRPEPVAMAATYTGDTAGEDRLELLEAEVHELRGRVDDLTESLSDLRRNLGG